MSVHYLRGQNRKKENDQQRYTGGINKRGKA
jgi:hypothetical protein